MGKKLRKFSCGIEFFLQLFSTILKKFTTEGSVKWSRKGSRGRPMKTPKGDIHWYPLFLDFGSIVLVPGRAKDGVSSYLSANEDQGEHVALCSPAGFTVGIS